MSNLLNIEGNSSLLILAPHTIFLKRNNEVHIPELFIKRIAKKLYRMFDIRIITWKEKPNRDKVKYLDPNYLKKQYLKNSIWFKKISEYALNTKLMIDIHGMKDTHNCDIIFGLESIKKILGIDEYGKYELLINLYFSTFAKKYSLNIVINKIFKGYISKNIYTLSSSGCSLGIPSIQIEISKSFRKILANDNKVLEDFGECLLKLL